MCKLCSDSTKKYLFHSLGIHLKAYHKSFHFACLLAVIITKPEHIFLAAINTLQEK